MNNLIIKGRLTHDPETRKSASGGEFCRFTVAVDRRRKDDPTDFFPCVAFGKTAEFIQRYFTKGKEILLTGELHIDKYEKDGEKKTAISCTVNNAEFCGTKGSDAGSDAETTYKSGGVEVTYADDADDLPF